MVGYALVNACVTAVMFKYMMDLLPRMTRYTGMGFAWSVSVAAFAGFAPVIAQKLSEVSSSALAPSSYVVLSALIALTVLSIRGDGSTLTLSSS